MRRTSVTVQWLTLMIAAGCAPATALQPTAATCNAQAIVRLNVQFGAAADATLRQIAAVHQAKFDTVMQLGDRMYRVLLRSDTTDCASLIDRLNGDERVEYATLDQRKRPH